MNGFQKLLLYILSAFVPIIGIILAIIWWKDPVKKDVARSCLGFSMLLICINFIAFGMIYIITR